MGNLLLSFYSTTETWYCMFYLSARSNRFFSSEKQKSHIHLSLLIRSLAVELITSSEKCLWEWSAVNKHLTVPLAMHAKISSIFDIHFCATEIRLQLCWQFLLLQRYLLRELGQILLLLCTFCQSRLQTAHNLILKWIISFSFFILLKG